MGLHDFGIPKDLALFLRDLLDLRTFVETGTNKAGTAAWAADHFDRVTTIEGDRALYEAARSTHGRLRNVRFVHGDSGEELGGVLENVGQPALVWLDAHWCGAETFGKAAECPLLDELEALNECATDHVIIIDDARFFTAPPPPPNDGRSWPGLVEVAQALGDRYALIYRDVIVAVPQRHREALVAWVHRRLAEDAVPPPLPLPQRLVRRLVHEGNRWLARSGAALQAPPRATAPPAPDWRAQRNWRTYQRGTPGPVVAALLKQTR